MILCLSDKIILLLPTSTGVRSRILFSYVVRGLLPLVGSPKANRSEVTGQTKSGSRSPDEKVNNEEVYVARNGITGAPPWSRGLGLAGERLVAGLSPTGPGWA